MILANKKVQEVCSRTEYFWNHLFFVILMKLELAP